MRDRGVVVSGGQTHIEWKVSKPFLNLLEKDGDRVGVVDIYRSVKLLLTQLLSFFGDR